MESVREWVQDWYGDYPGGSLTDPQGPASGSFRAARGGSWTDFNLLCRSSTRFRPGTRLITIGFRLLRLAP